MLTYHDIILNYRNSPDVTRAFLNQLKTLFKTGRRCSEMYDTLILGLTETDQTSIAEKLEVDFRSKG